ncbi:MAG: hypothetical protein HF982_01620 [Desulfobacteraceae bacterium]|nr:hypothetical protein [Desulfobacteraceae bacterium]MBC2718293.1 hypothetical protein [Desulfobacteraceae bacterium]
MRKVIDLQMKIGEISIADIKFDLRSRDEIPKLLQGLGYQLKPGHFLPFWPYGNSTIKQNLRSC